MGMTRARVGGTITQPGTGMNLALRCQRCGDVIGSYEPMILLESGGVRETSRAAEPKAASPCSEHYHRDCYIAEQPVGDVHI
jgi:hypothetical protein